MQISYDVHQPSNIGGAIQGLGSDPDPRAMVAYFLPMVLGPIGAPIAEGWGGMWGYWGVLPSLFALLAIIFAVLPRTNHPPQLRALTFFFAAALVLMLLKRFGSPIINWIGFALLPNGQLQKYTGAPYCVLCRHAGRHWLLAVAGGTGKRGGFLAAGALLLLPDGQLGFQLDSSAKHSSEFFFAYYFALLVGVLVFWQQSYSRELSERTPGSSLSASWSCLSRN